MLADSCAIVLFEPQDPINIGSVVRACRNTGLRDLRIINPADPDIDRIRISATHSEEFLRDDLQVVSSWEEAVTGLHRVYALTARGRHERHRRLRLDEAVDEIESRFGTERVGFVFGREDHGLPNAIIDRCDAYVTIRTADHTSLNLAQAVMLVAHGLFTRLGEAEPLKPPGRAFEPAQRDHVERMLGDAEAALDAIGFFKGDQRENVMRTLNRILLKAEVDTQELATLWGIFAEVDRVAKKGVR